MKKNFLKRMCSAFFICSFLVLTQCDSSEDVTLDKTNAKQEADLELLATFIEYTRD
jgi:hypothetical protein